MTVPIYLVARSGARRDETALALGETVCAFDSVEALGRLDDLPPGVILIDCNDASDALVLDLVSRVVADSSVWRVGVALEEDCKAFQSLSLGPLFEAGEISAKARDSDTSRDMLAGMRFVLEEVAEARHLLNNQLTSALAEIQLLLLDVTDDEAREAYVVIHHQLRSMRDVIAGMIRTSGSSRWA